MNFDKILSREGNGSKKWNREYINSRFGEVPKNIYPFFIADMDFSLPKEIHEEVTRELSHGDFGYFDLQESYYDSIVRWYKQTKDITLQKEWLLPSVGTVSSMHFIAKTVENPVFATLTPVYGSFKKLSDYYGKLVEIPLLWNEGKYEISFELFEKYIIQNNINVILFCNPHNPSGQLWSFEELEQLVSLCKKYDVLIMSDEIHSDLCKRESNFISLIHFFDRYKNIVISNSPNKAFNLSGLNSSYIITHNNELLKKINYEHEKLHISVNKVGAKYTEVVYRKGIEWLENLEDYLENNIDLLISILDLPGIHVVSPESGYLIWIELENIKDVDLFVRKLAQKTGVLIETGSRFISNYGSFVRINVATSQRILEKGMLEFKEFYLSYEEE
ncbi:MalY/PatB family protein [Vagococcus fluvialis]|uniref:MalY/PatB family protein n=1 Tax=Vagococcus fluvialis TaxID=2738 RepID=UPI001A8DFE8A|nr:aminotransferase class I/II-fold pyridoxal phosphate-dependent enzyme [Vagococcus fluvialis]MBO0442659.1 aminotransferase class I/II-fold pyridoxal phosphate-dependent enzyme [Vagococcus fluvialis]MDT2747232.1 aminotransferase class I/II-fold pyridoxal phosphate-dependent enzyme [Vagococcus fluvialis]UDM72821.1 aminotransferase class I/II-fold pyridoxal phosphate-dependent enzyme [Vagococcus fluvialis]